MTEESDIQQADIYKAQFTHLIMMLASSALQHLGKMVDPVTQKAEIHLEAAQATIDVLDMLAAKTKGNVDDEEERMLKDTLSSLKMNYVQTQQEQGSAPEAAGPESTPETSAPADAVSGEAAAPSADSTIETTGAESAEDKEPRYHKKYD